MLFIGYSYVYRALITLWCPYLYMHLRQLLYIWCVPTYLIYVLVSSVLKYVLNKENETIFLVYYLNVYTIWQFLGKYISQSYRTIHCTGDKKSPLQNEMKRLNLFYNLQCRLCMQVVTQSSPTTSTWYSQSISSFSTLLHSYFWRSISGKDFPLGKGKSEFPTTSLLFEILLQSLLFWRFYCKSSLWPGCDDEFYLLRVVLRKQQQNMGYFTA